MVPDLEKYRGLWVGVWKDKVITSGKNAREVYNAAKKICKTPIIFQVPTKEEELCIL